MPLPARARLSRARSSARPVNAVLKSVVGGRSGPVSEPGDLQPRAPGELHPDTGTTFARPHTRPRLVRLDVSETVISAGTAVRLTWAFEGARTVSVDGVAGHPTHGQTSVLLDRTRQVEVVASSELGSTTVRSRMVTVIPIPRISALSVPDVSVVGLHADVQATVAAGDSVRAKLKEAMDAQDRFRPVLAERLHPIGVPTHFVRWLASAPRVSFFRSSS